MMLTHGVTDKGLNFWQDDTHTRLIQQSPIDKDLYVFYYRNQIVVDCGNIKYLESKYGLTLVEKQQTKEVNHE